MILSKPALNGYVPVNRTSSRIAFKPMNRNWKLCWLSKINMLWFYEILPNRVQPFQKMNSDEFPKKDKTSRLPLAMLLVNT